MKKSTIALGVLLLLGVLALVFIRGGSFGTLPNSEVEFSVKDSESIGMIFLGNKSGERVKLTRVDENNWLVDDNRPAKKESIRNILWVIRRMEVRRPVPSKARENIVKHLAGENVKVEVFDLEGELLRSYFLGNASKGYKGNYVLLEGAENPYEVYVPGFKGFLTGYFHTTAKDWFSRVVFDSGPGAIRSVSINYPHKPQEGFRLVVNSRQDIDMFRVTDGSESEEPLVSSRALDYLNFFQDIRAEAYLDMDRVDSIKNSTPFCEMELIEKGGKSSRFTVYYMPAQKGTKRSLSLGQNLPDYDVDRFLGLKEGDDQVMLIQTTIFEKLWRGFGEFHAKA